MDSSDPNNAQQYFRYFLIMAAVGGAAGMTLGGRYMRTVSKASQVVGSAYSKAAAPGRAAKAAAKPATAAAAAAAPSQKVHKTSSSNGACTRDSTSCICSTANSADHA